MKKNKQTNPQSYVYRCSDQQKGAQILPLAHPALHNKVFIPSGYGKARILQILRIDDLFEPCIVQIPIQRRTQKTHTHTHTHTQFFPLIKLPATTKLPEEEEDLETQKQAPQKKQKQTIGKKKKERKKKPPMEKRKDVREHRESQREMQHKKREKKKERARARESEQEER